MNVVFGGPALGGVGVLEEVDQRTLLVDHRPRAAAVRIVTAAGRIPLGFG
jgi:hypothetical protein